MPGGNNKIQLDEVSMRLDKLAFSADQKIEKLTTAISTLQEGFNQLSEKQIGIYTRLLASMGP